MQQVQSMTEVSIQVCTTLDEMRRCMELERAIWNDTDEDRTASAIYEVASKTGGQVLLACDEGKPVGLALAFAAFRDDLRYLHSHLVGVIPGYQDRGLGRRLKMRQRELALAAGISHMEWTFDPLMFGNARFNVNHLGATMRRYYPNLYGITGSPLHHGLPTDRFVAEWDMLSPRVVQALAGQPPVPSNDAVEVIVPAEVLAWEKSDPSKVMQVQERLRVEFGTRFAEGLAVTGFRMENGNGTYLLEPLS